MRYSTQWDYDNMDDGYVDEPESEEEEEEIIEEPDDEYDDSWEAEQAIQADYARYLDWLYK